MEDREERVKLKARYVNYNDDGCKGPTHTQPAAVADLFAEDGLCGTLCRTPAMRKGAPKSRPFSRNFRPSSSLSIT